MIRGARPAMLALAGLTTALEAPPSREVLRPAPVPAPALADTGTPAVTLLYQNFPNPFPTAQSRSTCIWFDLSRTTSVDLSIHDVRGNLVRRLLPTPTSPQLFAPGRYGRATPTAESGCDPSLTWDGRADDGSVAPRGVYLIRLRAGSVQSIKKAVFQGP